MSYRFAVNKLCGGAADVLWEFYSFMKAASPTGPGWTVAGSSNGTAGGMGNTTAITSASSLSSSNAWFVLTMPGSSGRQILMHRDVGASASTGELHFFYNDAGDYTGGSATTLPTSPSGRSKEVFTSTTWIGGSGYFQFLADDASPYGWAWFGWSGTTGRGCCAMIPLVTTQPGEADPYVCHGETGEFTAAALITVSATNTTASPKAWDATGANWAGVGALRQYGASNLVIPGAGAAGISSRVVSVPICFCNIATDAIASFKGFCNMALWPVSAYTSKNTYFYGATDRYKIQAGALVLPWDGATDPT